MKLTQITSQTTSYIKNNIEYIIFFTLVLILAILIARRSWEGFFTQALGINQLDAIIYINLENRTDRKDFLLKDLEALGTNMSKVHKISGVYMPKNGHKGCIQSHILALNMIKLNAPRWKRVLILEDDAELTENPDKFNAIISQSMSKLDEIDPNWNVIMLATAWKIIHEDNIEKLSLEFINDQGKKMPLALERLKKATTSSAYIVKDTYVDEILSLFDTCNKNMEPEKLSMTEQKHEPWALDQQWESLQARDRWYCLNKDPIKQRDIWSTILTQSHG